MISVHGVYSIVVYIYFRQHQHLEKKKIFSKGEEEEVFSPTYQNEYNNTKYGSLILILRLIKTLTTTHSKCNKINNNTIIIIMKSLLIISSSSAQH